MAAEVLNFFDYRRHSITKQIVRVAPEMTREERMAESLMRWDLATRCGDFAASYRGITDFYEALLGDWPAGDKPCDT